ncbi:MAG TPA: hypothetical protein VFB72_18675 [Verrucomicrobiae bacterium]|nr:hypothetical protein [Verrucomicrobiae bacterium]
MLLALAGCSSNPTPAPVGKGSPPPLPVARVTITGADTVVHHSAAYLAWIAAHPGEPLPVAQTYKTYTLSAYFYPVISAVPNAAFFSTSTDLQSWTVIASFDYPMDGSTLACTNAVQPGVNFFRAGYTVP